jgi:SAM-dependent methyltransferase
MRNDWFSGHAAAYAAARPGYPAGLFEVVAAHAPARRCAWDCGTGNGQVAAGLARYFDAVEASDMSAAQIAAAPAAPRVRYRVEPAEQTSYAAAQFDAIVVAQALHWFDIPRFGDELRRVAAPGAVLVACGYAWFEVDPAFDAAFAEDFGRRLAPFWAPQNRLLWRGYRDVTLPIAPIATPALAIHVEWTWQQLMAYVWSWSAVQRALAAHQGAALDEAADRLAGRWGERAAVRRVTMPLSVIAGHVLASTGMTKGNR